MRLAFLCVLLWMIQVGSHGPVDLRILISTFTNNVNMCLNYMSICFPSDHHLFLISMTLYESHYHHIPTSPEAMASTHRA